MDGSYFILIIEKILWELHTLYTCHKANPNPTWRTPAQDAKTQRNITTHNGSAEDARHKTNALLYISASDLELNWM